MSVTTAFTNHSEQTVNIGGRSVLPGETREVDARFVPASPETNRQLLVLYINFNDSVRYFGTNAVQPLEAMRLPVIHFENPNLHDAGKIQDQIFTELLDRKIDDIKPYFSQLNDEEVSRLVELEQVGDQRKSLLKVLQDELAVRDAERNFDPETYAQTLAGMDESELQIELLATQDNSMKTQVIEQALSALKSASTEIKGS
ncbi:ABC transporter ATPase [Vibrio sp. PP-XX7]